MDTKPIITERLDHIQTLLLQQKTWSLQMKGVLQNVKEAQLNRQRKFFHSQRSAVGTLRGFVAEFFDCISLPGVKYVATIYSFERCLWLLVLLLSTSISSTYMAQLYRRWQESPVIIGFNDSMVHVSYIPFPAVTFCPQRQTSPLQFYWNSTCLDRISFFSRNKNRCYVRNPDYYPLDFEFYKCTRTNASCTENEWLHLYAAHLLCPNTIILPQEHTYDLYDSIVVKYIYKLIPVSSDDVVDYRFNKGRARQASHQQFQTVFVDGEVCYTFNMLPASHLFKDNVTHPGLGVLDSVSPPVKEGWSPDTMFLTPDLSDTLPRHVGRATQRSGLEFLTIPFSNKYVDRCTPYLRSLKIGLHHPAELPTRESLHYIRPTVKLDVHLRVTPQLTTTEDGLRDYEPARRRCHFSDERTLALYRVYTQNNCHTECFVNCSLAVCGCVPYSLPSLIDEVYSWKYVVENFYDLLGASAQDSLVNQTLEWTNPNCSCDCPNTCTSLRYDADISSHVNEKVLANHMKFVISFGDSYYPTILRRQFMGLKDVIAECGGVLGVFTGFSFIALSEMIYFITLRLWITVKKSSSAHIDTNNIKTI